MQGLLHYNIFIGVELRELGGRLKPMNEYTAV
jgi:hypothetical protein